MDLRLLVLCIGNFVIGTGTLIVPGMLPSIAHGLQIEVPVAAQLITAFAFTICITAPPLAALTSRLDRRRLLVWVQLLYAGGHLASAFATSFEVLLALRVITSIGAGLFTAQAASAAALLVPQRKRGSAVAFVFLGWSLASVAGMPIGAYVGETLGWHAGFALVAFGALLAAAAVQATIPARLFVQTIDRSMWLALLKHPALILVIAVTAIQSAAQFTIFSFIVPAIKTFHAPSPATISMLLALFGLTGVIGNVIGARLIDRLGAERVVLLAMLSMLLAHIVWPATTTSMTMLIVSLLLWGIGCFSANSAQQARLVLLSPAHAPVSVAMNSSAIYLGQAIGTATGGSLLTAAGNDGYTQLTWLSIPLFVLAIVISTVAGRRSPRHPHH